VREYTIPILLISVWLIGIISIIIDFFFPVKEIIYEIKSTTSPTYEDNTYNIEDIPEMQETQAYEILLDPIEPIEPVSEEKIDIEIGSSIFDNDNFIIEMEDIDD
jgi:hypothetical protein